MKTTKLLLFWIFTVAAIVMALGLSGGTVFAAASAFDTAANYIGTWGNTPPNGGSGFGSWDIEYFNGNNPVYSGTYLDASSAVTSSGYSWGMYADTGTGNNYGRELHT
jgi:hypothetical protein